MMRAAQGVSPRGLRERLRPPGLGGRGQRRPGRRRGPYPGVAVLADWYTLAAAHPEWFTADQVHLNPAGATALAALIARSA